MWISWWSIYACTATKCDVLIIVPDETTNRGNKVTIGKGLAEQIQQHI
jgi:hypothetical protein